MVKSKVQIGIFFDLNLPIENHAYIHNTLFAHGIEYLLDIS